MCLVNTRYACVLLYQRAKAQLQPCSHKKSKYGLIIMGVEFVWSALILCGKSAKGNEVLDFNVSRVQKKKKDI